MPDRRIGAHRLIASSSLAVMHGALAIAYTFPWLARSSAPPRPGQVSIVLYIDSLGPVWQLAFGLTAAVLLAGLVWPRWLALAHTLGGAALAVFSAGLWLGYALSEPRPSMLTALGYSACVVWHLTIGVTYSKVSSLQRRDGQHSRTRKGVQK